MNNKTAKQIVNEALNIAISKGCFGLIEVSNIVKALDFLNDQPDVEFGEISQQEANEIRETKLG
jgi:hypothetical protein